MIWLTRKKIRRIEVGNESSSGRRLAHGPPNSNEKRYKITTPSAAEYTTV